MKVRAARDKRAHQLAKPACQKQVRQCRTAAMGESEDERDDERSWLDW